MAYTTAQITRIDSANRESARKARNLTEAFVVREAANDLFTALSHADGIYSTRANHSLLDLCNGLIDLLEGGDAKAMRDSLMFDLRCDEYGNPIRDPDEPQCWPDADKRRVFGGYR